MPDVRREYDGYTRFIKALGARIRAMRKESGWIYRDMVVLHGFQLSAWQGFETAKNGISLPSLLRVARTFGIHPAKLIAGIEVGSGDLSEPAVPAKAAAKVTRKRIGTARSHSPKRL